MSVGHVVFLVLFIAVALLAVVIAGAIAGAVWKSVRAGWRAPLGDSRMDEGDYHSGPEGYSPNTAYQNSWYGTMGEHEEGEHR